MRLSQSLVQRLRVIALVGSLVVACASLPAYAQAPTAPAPAKGAAPAGSTAKPEPARAPVARPPPAADVRFTARYTTGDQVTERA